MLCLSEVYDMICSQVSWKQVDCPVYRVTASVPELEVELVHCCIVSHYEAVLDSVGYAEGHEGTG